MALAGRLKRLVKQGEGVIASNKGTAHQVVDRVAAEADKRTRGKYRDKIRRAEQKAGEAVDKIGEPEGGGTDPHPRGGPSGR
jgi:antitoxin protein of toxin-antitoxin system